MTAILAEKTISKDKRKILSVSPKRQITIPQKFYQSLSIGDEVECIMHDGLLIIRPIKTVSEEAFSEQILADLIKEGWSGESLLAEFKKRQAQIRSAIESMLSEAANAAQGKSEFASYDDVFKAED